MKLDINKIRSDFPILSQKIHNKPLVYFDNGATTQKPIQVINRITDYYSTENSNVHRGIHYLSQLATDHFEDARKYISEFIGAGSQREVIFTKGATEAINLVATAMSDFIFPDDEIIVTDMEHHSNMVPWQQLCIKKKATLKHLSVLPDGSLDLDELEELISSSTKLLAIAHISNVLGTINPIKKIIEIAHKHNVPVLIDGAQAIAHIPVNVQELDCDFYAFSAHKAYGPMGMGALYGKAEWLDRLPPYQFGGEMISSVSFKETTFNEIPFKFEAGTPDVAGALGMEAGLRYIESHGIKNIRGHEDDLLEYATKKVKEIPDVKIIGESKDKTAVLSLIVDGVHPFDLGTLLDQMGIAIRTGNHCAQPLMECLSISGTLRASFAIYNTKDEVDIFIEALKKALKMLQ